MTKVWASFRVELEYDGPTITSEVDHPVFGKVRYFQSEGSAQHTLWVEYPDEETFNQEHERSFTNTSGLLTNWLELSTPGWQVWDFDLESDSLDEPEKVDIIYTLDVDEHSDE